MAKVVNRLLKAILSLSYGKTKDSWGLVTAMSGDSLSTLISSLISAVNKEKRPAGRQRDYFVQTTDDKWRKQWRRHRQRTRCVDGRAFDFVNKRCKNTLNEQLENPRAFVTHTCKYTYTYPVLSNKRTKHMSFQPTHKKGSSTWCCLSASSLSRQRWDGVHVASFFP